MIKVASVQINSEFSGQYYLPYSVGLLLSYFKKNSLNAARYDFMPPIYKRDRLDDMLNAIIDCDIALFSTYVWNINISLALAEQLKRQKREVVTIFGGPSVPDKPESFLRLHPFVDLLCHQEGERTLTSILDQFPSNNWHEIPGISYRNNKGSVITNAVLPRIRDLTVLPSPYLDGTFDELMGINPERQWLISWETNRGCPFACAYCDWGSAINSKVGRMDLEKLYSELEWFGSKKMEFIFVCDANFGMLSRDFDIAQKAVQVRQQYGYPHVLSVQATKNARERSYKVQKLLYDGGLHKSINLAVQSTDEVVLKNIRRGNISIDDYATLQQRFSAEGIPTYSDLIIGLPGDNFVTFKKSTESLISRGQHNRIQFNNLSILPNAELANEAYKLKYSLQTVTIPIVNMHGTIEENLSDGIVESQELVISSTSMSKNEWTKIRVFATAMEFFYFNKVLQIPILLLANYAGKKVTDIVLTLISEASTRKYPTLNFLKDIFENNAKNILLGKSEFIYSKKWLGIYWPPGEYAVLKLIEDGILDKFYREAAAVCLSIGENSCQRMINDAVIYNNFVFKRPGRGKHEPLVLDHDIAVLYNKALRGINSEMTEGRVSYSLELDSEYPSDSDVWAKEVLWYGHRRGEYLHKVSKINLAGE